MAGEVEVERLLVRLVGDAADYQRMLRDAQAATVKANKGIVAATRRMAKAVATSLTTAGRAFQKFGRGLQSFGRSLSLRVTAPIVGFGVASLKMGADFEATMQKMVGLVGVSQDQINAWSKEFITLGPKLGKTPIALAEAMFPITSAGLRGQAAMDALVNSAKAGIGGLGDLNPIADAVTSAMNAYGQEVLGSAKATDILVAAVREGKLEPESLAGIMGSLLPMASAMGVAFEDVAGSLAAMSRTGSTAAEAAISVQGVLMTLSKPTDEATKMLAKMEQETGDARLSFQGLRDMVRQSGGIIDVFRLLDTTFGDDEEALAAIIPNIRALRGAMNLLAQDADTVDSVMKGVRDSAGSTQAAFDVASKTFKFKFGQALAQVNALLITLGTTFLPLAALWLGKVTDALTAAIAEWNKLDEATKQNIVTIGIVVATVGPAITALGGMVALLGFMTIGVGALGNAIAIMGVKAAAAWGKATLGLSVLATGLVAIGLHLFKNREELDGVFKAFEPLIEAVKESWQEMKKMLVPELEKLGKVLASVIKPVLLTVLDIMVRLIPAITSVATVLATILVQALTAVATLLDFIIPNFEKVIDIDVKTSTKVEGQAKEVVDAIGDQIPETVLGMKDQIFIGVENGLKITENAFTGERFIWDPPSRPSGDAVQRTVAYMQAAVDEAANELDPVVIPITFSTVDFIDPRSFRAMALNVDARNRARREGEGLELVDKKGLEGKAGLDRQFQMQESLKSIAISNQTLVDNQESLDVQLAGF